MRKPMPHEPCSTPDIKPRERAGQVSIARAAPAGHSAPIPMPSSARIANRNEKLGERPARKLQTEYQRMEIISGARRPMRSAIHPAMVAPNRRMTRVMEKIAVTSMSGTLNSCAIGAMINRKTVKSKASSVQPNQAAIKAYHWSLVGSFHQGTFDVWVEAVMCVLAFSSSHAFELTFPRMRGQFTSHRQATQRYGVQTRALRPRNGYPRVWQVRKKTRRPVIRVAGRQQLARNASSRCCGDSVRNPGIFCRTGERCSRRTGDATRIYRRNADRHIIGVGRLRSAIVTSMLWSTTC